MNSQSVGIQSYIGSQPIDNEEYNNIVFDVYQNIENSQVLLTNLDDAERQANEIETRLQGIDNNVSLFTTATTTLNNLTQTTAPGMVLRVEHYNFTNEEINNTTDYANTLDMYKANFTRHSATSYLLVVCDFDYHMNDTSSVYKTQLMVNYDPTTRSQEYELTTAHVSERLQNTIMYKTDVITTFPGVSVQLQFKRDVGVSGTITIKGVRITIYEINP